MLQPCHFAFKAYLSVKEANAGTLVTRATVTFSIRFFFSHCALRCMTIINCQTKLLLFGLDPVHSMQSCYSAGLLFLHQSAARVPPSMPFSVAHEDWFRPPDFGEQAFQRKKAPDGMSSLFSAL